MKEIEPYVFKGDKPILKENAFVSTETKEPNEDKDENLRGTYCFSTSPESALLVKSTPHHLSKGSDSTKSDIPNRVSVERLNVLKILLKAEEHKSAYTTSFEAYLGSQLTPMEVMIQDLNDMNPNDVEEMDIQWNMVLVAYRTQGNREQT